MDTSPKALNSQAEGTAPPSTQPVGGAPPVSDLAGPPGGAGGGEGVGGVGGGLPAEGLSTVNPLLSSDSGPPPVTATDPPPRMSGDITPEVVREAPRRKSDPALPPLPESPASESLGSGILGPTATATTPDEGPLLLPPRRKSLEPSGSVRLPAGADAGGGRGQRKSSRELGLSERRGSGGVVAAAPGSGGGGESGERDSKERDSNPEVPVWEKVPHLAATDPGPAPPLGRIKKTGSTMAHGGSKGAGAGG
jgi:hypothetical protein